MSIAPKLGPGVDTLQFITTLADNIQQKLGILKEIVTTPEAQKQPRLYGIKDAANMVSKSAAAIRKYEAEGKVSPAKVDDNGKRVYTLADINLLRNAFRTRYVRPSNTQPFTLAVTNFKGGCGKTTTTVHLAQKAALEGLRVLVIDLDPQGSTTFLFGIRPDYDIVDSVRETIYNSLLSHPSDILDAIRPTHFDGLDLIPASLILQLVDLNLVNPEASRTDILGLPVNRLKNALDVVHDRYDLIVMDCGPNLGAITANALKAANGALIPMPPLMPDFASSAQFFAAMEELVEVFSLQFSFFRILLTKHPGHMEAAKVESVLREIVGEFALQNAMPNTIGIERASNDMGTIYDLEFQTSSRKMHLPYDQRPAGSREAYNRAVYNMDRVCNEILGLLKMAWEQDSKTAHMEVANG